MIANESRAATFSRFSSAKAPELLQHCAPLSFHTGRHHSAVCTRIREETGVAVAVLSGGVFLNALLTAEVLARLAGDGFRVYRHRLVPPNDAGLSLGQAAIAAARLMQAR